MIEHSALYNKYLNDEVVVPVEIELLNVNSYRIGGAVLIFNREQDKNFPLTREEHQGLKTLILAIQELNFEIDISLDIIVKVL